MSSSQSSRSHNKPEQSASQLQQQQHQAHAQQLQQLQQLQLSAMQQQLQLSPNAFAQRQQNGLPPNPAMMEEWMKQMQLMQMQYAELVKSGNIPSGSIPIAPSELQAAQQTQMAQMAAAAAAAQAQQVGISVDPNMAMAALLYQQQQQQQQSAEALASLQAAGAQNMIHFMHPAMAPAAAHHPAALAAGLYDPSLAFGKWPIASNPSSHLLKAMRVLGVWLDDDILFVYTAHSQIPHTIVDQVIDLRI